MTRELLDSLFDSSPSLEQFLEGARRAAESNAPVLILGEPGTGRSSLARALHSASPRHEGPLVEVDIGAIPSALFESEFFGYSRGAFTGAEAARAGRVARAEGGTLILDHVEELPLAAQAKLLRLLAEGVYAPLGGADARADLRFVAVAAADLAQRVATGSFRPDLFYRLEVLTLRLPSLGERRDDLPRLVEALLADLAARFGRPRLELADRAWRWIDEYRWPGNVRQLRNVLERELILHPDRTSLDPEPPGDLEGRPRPLAEVEADQIRAALAYTRGHQGRAAELLGISRKTLWEKRRRYGIP